MTYTYDHDLKPDWMVCNSLPVECTIEYEYENETTTGTDIMKVKVPALSRMTASLQKWPPMRIGFGKVRVTAKSGRVVENDDWDDPARVAEKEHLPVLHIHHPGPVINDNFEVAWTELQYLPRPAPKKK